MLLAKLYWESNPTVLDLTPLGGSARLVSAVTISPPFFHVFVTQRKALAVCFSTFVIWTDWSLRTKDSEFVELKSPSVISSYLRSSSLTYNLFTLGSKACLVLLLLWGLSQFRVLTLVLRVVSQSCPVLLQHVNIWANPVSTGSTGKTPIAFSGSRIEPGHRRCKAGCGAIDSVRWVARQTCSAAIPSGTEKALHFTDAFLSKKYQILQALHSLRESLCCHSQVHFCGILGAVLFPFLCVALLTFKDFSSFYRRVHYFQLWAQNWYPEFSHLSVAWESDSYVHFPAKLVITSTLGFDVWILFWNQQSCKNQTDQSKNVPASTQLPLEVITTGQRPVAFKQRTVCLKGWGEKTKWLWAFFLYNMSQQLVARYSGETSFLARLLFSSWSLG